ncbi:MAG: hypothetical protein UX49_C0009G0037 [Candidatus Wolfebacteria bacterium GW2011_GWC2_46_275]|uniref:Integral membrane protein CcmA involved in cell shape determination n=2 Tax=Candidatus Wolfeibacteriota TaxID=1752735 RepID=A0A0G1U6D3_9BACT|nr:MAG: hypothetical protein UX70_C0001G0745 [Candidatus Wolfebacteria bacterium GW2011_GWB1_47_1]KKU36792.1 MAG: hypothetical protein UX49_C0009G0037 [Candidatus Wolfebacteria bacterium GW2011_GWC2_46_275]KKU42332.1 MAG: hypothetical protein UX58_C0002G0046 [Candidatus Wolfebacteria bacterium GW2011_GWB2_46_69]KKU53662.1 MAG: hypothetical protein UX76_C0011G0007 [Candidatus Wolfebacteria bacterium GW2011_GWC1_47_103]KKU58907.1 MAG: hypothetical protein UX83_C0010G0029 [Candidatus Wolfebacteria
MKQLKQIAVTAFVISMVVMPMFVYGADMRAAREYTLQKGEVVESDLYVGAENNVVAGEIRGDLVIAGGSILVVGDVDQDVIAAGGAVEVLGNVGDDIRAVGGAITIGKNVSGDVVAAGGVVQVISGATVEGDVIVAGGQAIIDGTVKGDVKIVAGEVIINGVINGDVSIRSDKRFSIGKDAKIEGALWYRSPNAVEIAEGGMIIGETQFEKVERPDRTDKRIRAAMLGLIGAMALVKLLIILVTAIAGVILFKKVTQGLVKVAADHFGRELVRGFVVLIVMPAAILIAMISLIGIWFAVAGVLLYVLLLMIAKVLAGILLGAVLMKMAKKTKDYEVNWQNATIGVLVLELIWIIPIIGWVAVFLLFLASVGSVALMAYQKTWLKR